MLDLNILAMSSTAAQSGAEQSGGSSFLFMIIFLVFIVGYMFLLTRKDKKNQQAEQNMRDTIKIGDEVLTIGGVIGKVVTVKEESVDIETGADRTKLRFTKSAIAKNITADKKAEELKAAKVRAAAEAKASKSKEKK